MVIPMFTFGKHRNRPHDEVAADDPGYIVWAYENVKGHADIPNKLYRECQLDVDDLEDDLGMDELIGMGYEGDS